MFAPLAYAIHHTEEHLLLNFREWRLRYFPDNNALSTEAVFIIITAITLIYIIAHQKLRTKETVWFVMIFLMASQVVNTLFHLGTTLLFWDFSPGLITALLVYAPVNVFICRAALREELLTKTGLLVFFVIGAILFAGFEKFGPFVMLSYIFVSWIWIAVWPKRSIVLRS